MNKIETLVGKAIKDIKVEYECKGVIKSITFYFSDGIKFEVHSSDALNGCNKCNPDVEDNSELLIDIRKFLPEEIKLVINEERIYLHKIHCNQGENEGICKYGDPNCLMLKNKLTKEIVS